MLEIERAVEIYRGSTSNVLGTGNFGTAHYITTSEGPAVLKILRTKPRKGMDENEEAEAILANLKTLKPLLPPSFVPLLHIPQTGAWYVRGYAPGETVSKQLPELTRHQKQEISHAYGAMLKQAHANDIIIGSTGWDDFVWDPVFAANKTHWVNCEIRFSISVKRESAQLIHTSLLALPI